MCDVCVSACDVLRVRARALVCTCTCVALLWLCAQRVVRAGDEAIALTGRRARRAVNDPFVLKAFAAENGVTDVAGTVRFLADPDAFFATMVVRCSLGLAACVALI